MLRVAGNGTRGRAGCHRRDHRLPLCRGVAAYRVAGYGVLGGRDLHYVARPTLAFVGGNRFIAYVLAYSPGGVAETSLIALSLDVEVPFVVLHHIVRVRTVVAVAGVMFRVSSSR